MSDIGKYYVYNGEVNRKWFKGYRGDCACLTVNANEAMCFTNTGMARAVASDLASRFGCCWNVFDYDHERQKLEKAKKLLQDIFSEDGEGNG